VKARGDGGRERQAGEKRLYMSQMGGERTVVWHIEIGIESKLRHYHFFFFSFFSLKSDCVEGLRKVKEEG
jgi:hypothetical protein